eukprot:843777-Prymnesium_polylepis.1
MKTSLILQAVQHTHVVKNTRSCVALCVSFARPRCRRAGGTGVMILGRGAPCCYRCNIGRYPGLLAAR